MRTGLKVLVLDAVLLLAEFEIIQDMQNRIQCALGSPLYGQTCMARSLPSFSYSLLTHSFSMNVGGVTLASPPTLDWALVLGYAVVALNVWFAYKMLQSRRSPTPAVGGR